MTLDELYAKIEDTLTSDFRADGTNTFCLLDGTRRHSPYLITLTYYQTIFRGETVDGRFRLSDEDREAIERALVTTARFNDWGSGEGEDAQAILRASGVRW